MNAAEQRRQHTVAQRLEQTSESVAVLLDALDARLFDQASKAQETRREVNTLNERLENVRDVMGHHFQKHAARDRSLWGRLRWLFTGQ